MDSSGCFGSRKGSGKTRRESNEDPFVVLSPGITIRICLFILGLNPFTYSPASRCYTFQWCSLGAVYTLFTLAWLSALIVTSFIGLLSLLSNSSHHTSGVSDLQIMGVAIVFGCLFNAWLNVLTILLRARQYCDLYNGWLDLISFTGLDPHKGIKLASHIYAAFLLVFVIIVLAMGVAGPPDLLLAIVDLLTKVLFLIDTDRLAQDDTATAKLFQFDFMGKQH
ncbi:hypothetical protein E2C01_036012 [Portunus trituberculatus]|uniref:Uncharacterized protein n=1 Tax=Portunus trituberculatus TaxID=210409 RepID=A0A5B7F5S0_PORTR|nr:hypothetical protein [Portunus trituberculatus]